MSAIVAAITITEATTGSPVIVVGGLAVLCRLCRPHRATTDLDTVNRRRAGDPSQLELLVASGGRPSGPSGVQVDTPLGPVQVDVLEVSDAEMDQLPVDPTDRLHVLSHAWTAETATTVTVRSDGGQQVRVLVARPGALIAMKLQSIMNRGAAKEATDLLDIVRLTLDPECGATARLELAEAHPQLRQMLSSIRSGVVAPGAGGADAALGAAPTVRTMSVERVVTGVVTERTNTGGPGRSPTDTVRALTCDDASEAVPARHEADTHSRSSNPTATASQSLPVFLQAASLQDHPTRPDGLGDRVTRFSVSVPGFGAELAPYSPGDYRIVRFSCSPTSLQQPVRGCRFGPVGDLPRGRPGQS